MSQYFPILQWLPRYQRKHLRDDFLAGITVVVVLIPQGMAYALLAGLPPITGLYAALIALLIYPIFGTSRELSVGPMALDSLLVASSISVIADAGTETYILLAVLLALMVGVVQFLLGAFRMGFLVNFLSHPVISGFTSAAAFLIGFSQLKYLMRIDVPGSQQILTMLIDTFRHISEVHLISLLIGSISIALLLALRSWKPNLPGALVVVVLGTLAVWLFDWHANGVQIVGEVPYGLPKPALPVFDLATVERLYPAVGTIALVSFMEAIAVSKKFAARARYKIDANQELMALGASNITAGFFGGYNISGSFSRTAVNAYAGARSGLASLFTALVIALTLMFLTPLLYYMPKAVLASIVIVSVIGLVDYKEARRLYQVRRPDFTLLVFTFLITLLLGARYGMLLSILASLVLIIRRISHPHVALMGQIPGTDIVRNLRRAPEAMEIEGLVIFRIDASLYFANIAYLKENIEESITERKDKIRAFIFDASSINEIDSSADTALQEIADAFERNNISLYFTNVKGPVRDMMKRSGLYDKLGEDHFFFSKKSAVRHYLRRHPQYALSEVEEG